MNITARIDELNHLRGWSIYKLAQHADLSVSTLTSIMNGRSSPSFATLEKLANAYNLSLSVLLSESETNNHIEQKLCSILSQLTIEEQQMTLAFAKSLLYHNCHT